MPLCEHLGADQQIQFALAEIKQRFFKQVTARLCVPIDAADSQHRKALAQNLFNLLSSFADVIDVFAGTGGTLRGCALVVIAIMTNQRSTVLMISERNVAI